jgi:hypothetical protein
LTPTAQVDPQRGQISLSGQRGINSNINIDGMDHNQPFFGGIRGGERSNTAFTIPQESVKEFQVIAAGYSAEFGRSTGGVVTAVTKSGTNQIRGTAFYLLRPQDLSAQEQLLPGAETQSCPDRQRRSDPEAVRWIDWWSDQEGQGLLLRLLRAAAASPIRASSSSTSFRMSPRPMRRRRPTDYYKSLQVPFDQTNDAIAYLGRFDYNFSEANSPQYPLQSELEQCQSTPTRPGNQLFPNTVSALSNNGTEKDRTSTLVGQLTTFFRPNLVNELRAQYSREVRPRLANAHAAERDQRDRPFRYGQLPADDPVRLARRRSSTT